MILCCSFGMVSMVTETGVSGESANELFLFRSVIFDWLRGTSANLVGWRSSPRIMKTATSEIAKK